MYLSTKTDLSNLKTESTYQPDMSINPLSAAIRGVGAGLSLAPTVLEFATRDAEPLFDEPPTLFDRPIEFARSAAKGTIAPIIDNLAQSASEFRARQDEALVQSGIVSQVAYGVPYVLAGYVASGASPVSLGVGLGEARRQQEIRRGVDEETAATIGAVEGVVGAVGAAIPLALGKGMVQRFGFGVAANVIPGMAQRAAEQQVYGVRYADRAPDVLDPVAIAVDAVLGGAFGYLAGRMDTAVDVEAVNEALRTNIDVRTADAAPGAMTPQAFGIHNKMVTETIQAKAEGREPDYRPILEAEFRDSPEQMRNFEESLSAITAGRMVEDRPVYDSILDQIRPMYSEADARVNAKVASMAYTALAKRMGMTPEDLLSEMPLRVMMDSIEPLNALRQEAYVGSHSAPWRGDDVGASIDRLDAVYPADVYSRNAARFYGDGSGLDDESIRILQSLRGKPEAEVTIYRAVPKDVEAKINAGDWVSVNKRYAEQHGESVLQGEYQLVEMKVKAGDVFTSADSLHEQGYSPAGYNRDQVLRQSALPDTIDIGGVQRSTKNSNGQPIAQTEEGIRNFWSWFGDSKVVDDQGRPLVVYHGTRSDFDTFDAGKQGTSGQGSGEPGFFFEANRSNAERYGANVVEAYVALKSPLVVARGDTKYDYEGVYNRVAFSNFIDDAMEGGDDGVVFENVLDRGARSTQYVAFDPTQIKSATGNSGVFDPADPSILRQRERGSYSPPESMIRLTEIKDSSTFIHELGHHTLEMLGKLAADPKAPKQIKDDFATLMKRGGMKVEDWYTSDINTRRSAHETIADDFENYFATGQAPSLELNGIFRVVRDWMLGVYKTIRGEVQPEVRAVFDRMLATDEQIAMKSQVVDYLAVAERTQQLSQSSVDDNIEAVRNALDPEVEVVIDGVRVKPSMLVDETPVEVDAMVKLKECLLNVR